jgi:hypothetical protein
MAKKREEPAAFRKGKAFHTEVQDLWKHEAEGKPTREFPVTKPGAKPGDAKGRVDIHVDAGNGLVAVVEVKSTDWTRMSDSKVRRTVAEYSRQVWEYIDSKELRDKDVSPGMVLLGMPSDAERLRLVEELFEEEGIAVSWQDETVEDARVRHMRASPN